MTLVLLVLAVIWAVVLVPPALRARSEGRPADSISAFRRQLAVLRRTGPRTSPQTGGDQWSRNSANAPVIPMELRSTSSNRRAQTRRMVQAPPGARPSASAARQRTLQRRRSVLTGLAGLAAFTLIVGAVPAFRMVWVLHLVTDALLLAYVALLIHQRNVAAERDMKVRFLPGPVAMDPGLMRREPALLRRSAN